MSDSKEERPMPTAQQQQEGENLPVNPYKGQYVFRSKEMGDFFFSELQQQHAALDEFKAHTSAQFNSIQFTIDKLTGLLERNLDLHRLHLSPNPPRAESSDHEGDYARSPTPTKDDNRKDDTKKFVSEEEPFLTPLQVTPIPLRQSPFSRPRLTTSPLFQNRPPPHQDEAPPPRPSPMPPSHLLEPVTPPTRSGTGRLPGQKLPVFRGKDGENVLSWLQKIELALRAANVAPTDQLANVAPLIRGDADSWFYSFMTLYRGRPPPTYQEFRAAIIAKYEHSEIRDDHLRARLQNIKLGPQGLRGINDFVSKFRTIELQVHEMAFKDRLNYFIQPLPANLALYLRDQRFADMESVYESARQWASRRVNLSMKSHQSSPKSDPPKSKSLFSHSEDKTEPVQSDTEDDLDVLNVLDAEQLKLIHCYRCGKQGHFSRHCDGSKSNSKQAFKSKANAFYWTEEASDSSTDSDSDDSVDDLTMISLYELADDGQSVTTKSSQLPIFDADVDGSPAKVIMDTGATTVYISQRFIDKTGIKVMKISPRKIRVAGKDLLTTTSICTLRMKLGNLPPESITAYVFPLHEIDLVLGLPWLQHRNPRVDFRDMSYEFFRNGHRYHVYPSDSHISMTGITNIERFCALEDETSEYIDDKLEKEKVSVLPSTATIRQEAPLTNIKLENARSIRKIHVQNLQQYRSDSADKYRAALEKLANKRDDSAFAEPIGPGDLVMRSTPQETKLHPKLDGPFVVLTSPDKNTYQLATAKGYVLRNLTHAQRLRKLSAKEREKYTRKFRHASERLKVQDERARREEQLLDANEKLGETTTEHLQAQKASQAEGQAAAPNERPHVTPDVSKPIAETFKGKRELETALKTAPKSTPTDPHPPAKPLDVGKRLRKSSRKLRDG